MPTNNESGEVVTFEDSFGEATGEPVVLVTPVVSVETPVDEKPLEETVVEKPVEKPVDGVNVAGTNDDFKVLYEKEVQRVKSWEGRLSAAERRANEAQAKLKELEAKAPDTAGIKPGSLIDAEDPLIQSFIKEMGDDFIKPLDAYLKRQINEALKPFADKMPVIEKQVSTIDENRVQDHYAQILEQHNDVTEILESGELETWVDTLPYKDAVAAKQTMQSGTTKQVINLLTEFKEKMGKVKNDDEVKPNLTVVQKVPKAKLDAATAVKGGSYTVPKGKAAADDFEGAFKEAISN